jgi:dihydroorotase
VNTQTLTIRKPDDFHFHPRQEPMLPKVVPFTSAVFARAVAIPNTVPPKRTWRDVAAYRAEIIDAAGAGFEPIMAIMLTRSTTPETVREAAAHGVRVLKYIPKGVSTNSEDSIPLNHLLAYSLVLRVAEETGMIFSGHWELEYDVENRRLPEMAREAEAIPWLDAIAREFPHLRVIAEHASTEKMIQYIRQRSPANVRATLTAHHALITIDDVRDACGRITNPYNYCKPIAKFPADMAAVRQAMISGDPKCFFGSDSAPHLISAKQCEKPAAGIFSAPVALPLLAQIFEEHNALGYLDKFVSCYGADFYGLPPNTGTIKLVKEDWVVPEEYEGIAIFQGGQTLHWKVA